MDIGLTCFLTAETIARRTGGTSFHVSDLYDPDINVSYGSWYLRQLIDKYGPGAGQ